VDYRVAALAEIREYAPEYETAWDYADGKRVEVFANPTVARALRAAGVRFNINIARRPIDAVLDRLSVAAVTVVDAGHERRHDDRRSRRRAQGE
jgi:hypothetical protein